MADERFSRQSFLGDAGQLQIDECNVGIIGLGGGGSHIAQQLAHLGFKNFRLFDPDIFQRVNLNRTVGAYLSDVNKTYKVDIASRLISGLLPDARILNFRKKWEEEIENLQEC